MLNSKKLDLEWNPLNEGWSLMKNILANMSLSFLSRPVIYSHSFILLLPVASWFHLSSLYVEDSALICCLWWTVMGHCTPLHSTRTVPCLFLYIKALCLAWMPVCFPFSHFLYHFAFTLACLWSIWMFPPLPHPVLRWFTPAQFEHSPLVGCEVMNISDLHRTSWIAAINLAGESSCHPIC